MQFNSVFKGCENLDTIRIPQIKTMMVSNFSYLFSDCKKLRNLVKGEQFYATIAHDLTNMFYNCQLLKSIDLSNFDMQYLVYFGSVFEGCISLEEIKFGDNMQSEFLQHLEKAFKGCKSLKSVDLSHFETPIVREMQEMFSGCESLETVILPKVDTKMVVDMTEMFKNNKKLTRLELNLFDTSSLERFDNMFENFNTAEGVKMIVDADKISKIKDKIPSNVVLEKPQ